MIEIAEGEQECEHCVIDVCLCEICVTVDSERGVGMFVYRRRFALGSVRETTMADFFIAKAKLHLHFYSHKRYLGKSDCRLYDQLKSM